jgi:hypothetical protein
VTRNQKFFIGAYDPGLDAALGGGDARLALPSMGLKSIVLVTLLPAAIAHMLEPLPRCSTTVLPSAARGARSGKTEAMYS